MCVGECLPNHQHANSNIFISIAHPSPVNAQHACMCQPWSLMEVRFKCCDISAADIDPFTSCLLANTNTLAFFSSWGVCVREREREFDIHT